MRRAWRTIALLVFLGLARTVSGTERFFHGPEPFAFEDGVSSLVLEDLDGDDRPEAAAAIEPSGSVLVARNDGAGCFLPPERHAVGVGPLWLAGAELDGMPGMDLFAINAGSSSVSVLRNDGKGSFLPALDSVTGPRPRIGDLADLDGDGVLDAVTADWVSDLEGHIAVLVGDGHGSFRIASTVDLKDNAHSVALADFDGDGPIDLAVANSRGLGVLQFYRGRGDGGFQPSREGLLGGSIPRYMDTLPWGDSLPGLAVLTDSGELFHVRHRPEGFRGERIGAGSSLIVVADQDTDGLPDVLTVSRDGPDSALGVYPGLTGASFGNVREIAIGTIQPAALAVGDLDGDGAQDIVAGHRGRGLVLFRGNGSDALLRLRLPAPVAFQSWETRDAGLGLIVMCRSSLHGLKESDGGQPEAAPLRDFPGASFQSIASGRFRGGDNALIAVSDLTGARVLILSPDDPLIEPIARDVGIVPGALTSGDFDRDGIDDLVVADRGSSSTWLLLGPGRESWSSLAHLRSVETGAQQSALLAADFDGDQALDLAAATSKGVVLRFGDGTGGFPRQRLIQIDEAPRVLAATPAGPDGELLVAYGERFRRFRLPELDPIGAEVSVGGQIQDACIADLDGDGEREIIVATPEELAVSCCGGRMQRYVVGSYLKDLAVLDLTGDGILDLAAADSRAWNVIVLRGQSGESLFRRGDVDAGGRAELTDAVVILEHLFIGRGGMDCPDSGDTNDDGILSLTDAIVLLQHLFTGGPAPASPGPLQCGADAADDELGACVRGCSGGP